jgi:hypothetical protein
LHRAICRGSYINGGRVPAAHILPLVRRNSRACIPGCPIALADFCFPTIRAAGGARHGAAAYTPVVGGGELRTSSVLAIALYRIIADIHRARPGRVTVTSGDVAIARTKADRLPAISGSCSTPVA